MYILYDDIMCLVPYPPIRIKGTQDAARAVVMTPTCLEQPVRSETPRLSNAKLAPYHTIVCERDRRQGWGVTLAGLL